MNGAAEHPANNSSGTGTGTFTTAGGALFYSVTFTNLGSAANAAHIHAPADSANDASPVVIFSPPAATFGTFSGITTMTSPVTYFLMNQLGYVNIHSGNFGGGEIRGQVMPKY
jgi:hypothetical protein